MQPPGPDEASERREAERRAAWSRWAAVAVGGTPEQVEEAVQTALTALDAGATPAAAGALARLGRHPLTPDAAETLTDELARVRASVRELEGERRRWLRLESLVRERWHAAWLRSAAHASGEPAAPASAPAPTLRAFLAERSILILSYTGALLLIVATVLFELYGVASLPGWLRFGGVLVLDLVFAAAAVYCVRSARLRIVGQTYTAVFALLAPLVLVAAWFFLELEEQGLPSDLAILLAGAACATLYTALAFGLWARAYAVLAMLAAPAAWLPLLHLAGVPGPWWAAALTPLTAVYAALARAGRPPFSPAAEPFLHAAALLQLGAVAVAAVSPPGVGWPAAAAMALLAGVYVAAAWARPNRHDPLLALLGCALAFAFAAAALRVAPWVGPIVVGVVWGCFGLVFAPLPARIRAETRQVAPWAGHAIALAAGLTTLCTLPFQPVIAGWLAASTAFGLAVAYGALAVRGVPRAVAALAVALWPAALAGVLWQLPLGGWRPLPLSVAAAGLVVAGLRGGRFGRAAPALVRDAEAIGYGTAAVSLAWALALGRGPTRPVAAALLALAVVLALGAWLGRRRWMVALVAAAAVAGAAVLCAPFLPTAGLLGLSLLVYGAALYALAVLERWTGVAGGALVCLGGAVGALLWWRAAPGSWYVPAYTAFGGVVYGGSAGWRVLGGRPAAWLALHRVGGLGVTGAAALAGLVLTGGPRPVLPAPAAALVAVWALAGLLAADAALTRLRVLWYAVPVVAALGGTLLARLAGLPNLQWHVDAPALALVVVGAVAQYDRRLGISAVWPRVAAAVGCAALLGLTGAQSLERSVAWIYTVAWVLEAVGLLLAGIWLRSRVLVIAGTAGIGLVALRALVLVAQTVPLFAVFGAVALVLLAGGATLALLRDRMGRARTDLTRRWTEWS